MKMGATREEIDAVVQKAKSQGLGVQLNLGTEKTVVALLGSNTGQLSTDIFAVLPGVESVTRIMKPYKLASREVKPQDTLVKCDGGVEIGGERIIVIAGPCAVENEEQLMEAASVVKRAGASILRGGAFKPRTSPFSFQGLQKAGLELLAKARKQIGLPVVTEVVEPKDVELVSSYADMLQIGSRNMQNFALLTNAGKSRCPVVLKRGFSCTISEWLTAADYLLAEGNNVILCERGIRTFEDSVRFSLDISSIPVLKKSSHLPVIVDPSHAAGHYSLVPSIAKAAVASGADGLLIEVHPNPKEALVDGLQSLSPSDFTRLMGELKAIAKSVGRYI